MFQLS
jgi:phenylalanine ammonia-lyase